MYKSTTNKRFMQAIESLISRDLVKNKKQIAALLDISASTISEINSERMNVNVEHIQKLCTKFPEVNSAYILFEEGDILLKNDQARPIDVPNLFHVRLVSKYAYAGYLNGFSDEEYIDELPTVPFLIPEDYTPRGTYRAFEVRGDSMDDGTAESILDSDVVLARLVQPHLYQDSQLHIKKWNFVIVHKQEGIIVKKISTHNVDQKVITIHSLNPLYEDREINLSEVAQIFSVVQLLRNTK